MNLPVMPLQTLEDEVEHFADLPRIIRQLKADAPPARLAVPMNCRGAHHTIRTPPDRNTRRDGDTVMFGS